jgi:hypothetical protein
MKKSFLLFAAIVMILSFSTNVMAQVVVLSDAAITENTAAGAQLIVPMTLTETSPLHFGTMNLKTNAGGTVVLSTSNARTFSGGVTASTVLPVSTNAAYNVTGTYNETYALTLPDDITVTEHVGVVVGDATMIIDDLKARFNGAGEDAVTSKLSATGTDNFTVGGTLNVLAGQIGGIYAGTFDVSVDYN